MSWSRGDQVVGVFEDLAIGGAECGGFLLGSLPASSVLEVGRRQMPRLVRVLDDKDVVERLRLSVKRAGGQIAFARQTGVDRANLNHLLTGKRLPTASILKALNLGIVYVALGHSAGLALRKLPPRRRHG